MKKFLVALAFGLASIAAQAEASFDQIQSLIQQQQYSAAAAGLEGIIQNHPKSAKAFYAMAQAQAGMGNLEKARKALDIATGLNPSLDFAPASSVASLREAITPQVKKIEYVDTSHTVRNLIIGILIFAGLGGAVAYMYKKKQEREEKESAERAEADMKRAEAQAAAERERVRKENEAREALRQHPNYGNERFDPTNPDVLLPKKTKAQQKKEADALAQAEADAEARRQRQRAEAAEDELRRARYNQPAPSTTVVNSGSSTGDFAMGMVLGNMMGSSHHHNHDTERTVVRETVREVPAPSRDSSWDDTPAKTSSRSSSWDDDSSSRSSSRSSSWDDDSSSRSSSSWSSSSSDSSSSWSSSDSSSSSSSSSWD